MVSSLMKSADERGGLGKEKLPDVRARWRGRGGVQSWKRSLPMRPEAPPCSPPACKRVLITSSGQVTMEVTRPAPAPASIDSAP